MKINELDNVCSPDKQGRITEFCEWCCEELGIDVPHLRMAPKNDTTALGYTDMRDGSVTIVVGDRHQMDIMRTLAHELVHVRQMKSYEPDGATGSKDENEANAMAGVLMREWGQNNPDLYTEGVYVKEANAKQQAALYNPDGKTYRQQPMPYLDDEDPVNKAQGFDSFDDNEFAYDPETDQSIDNDKRNKKIANVLKGLTSKEQKILKMRFVDDMTLRDVGKAFNVGPERIRQIEQKALRKLRHPTRSDQLVPHTDNAEPFSVGEARLSMKKKKPSPQDRFNARLKDKHGIDLDANLAKYKEMMDKFSDIDLGAPKKADESFGEPSDVAKKRATAAQQQNIDDKYVNTVDSNSKAGIYKNTSEGIDKSSDVFQEYLQLRKMPTKQLRNMVARANPSDDVRGYDKAGAIAQILRDRHGDRKVNQAMGLDQNTSEGQQCWDGYEKKGTKKMFGKTVNNCVKKESVEQVDEAAKHRLLQQRKLSDVEYQKAKKLKGFNKSDYEWNSDEQLYHHKNYKMKEGVEQVDESKTARMMALITALGATYGLEDDAREFAHKISQNIHNAQNAEPNPGRPDPVSKGNMTPGSDRVMRPPVDEIAPAIAAVGRGVGAVAKGVGSMAKTAGTKMAINKMQDQIADDEANEASTTSKILKGAPGAPDGRPKSMREAVNVQSIKDEVMGAVRSGNPREMKRVSDTIAKRISDLMDLRGTAGKEVDAEIMAALPVLKKAQMMLREKTKVSEEAKKDACYNKVRSRYKVWPSAYASGALVQCRKKGAKNWGNKSKK